MNRSALTLLLIALILCLTGCIAAETPASHSSPLSEPIIVSEIPENPFTARIPEIPFGEPSYVIDDSENGRFFVSVQNITMEESAAYISMLCDAGYEKQISEQAEISGGTILQKDDAVLSIAVSREGMGILISIDR